MKNILLAPHPDDEALFGSYIIQRTKPLIVVCTDGTIHAKKFGIPIETRREESRQAAKILGAEIEFLGIPEEELTEELLIEKLYEKEILPNCDCLIIDIGFIFAPTKTGGQPQHDIVSDAAIKIPGRNMYYGTYSRKSFVPTGEMAINPTKDELKIKEQALACFTSQHGINKPIFDAVKNVPEYLSFKP